MATRVGGEVSGRLPFAGCVTALTWNGAPGDARREAGAGDCSGVRAHRAGDEPVPPAPTRRSTVLHIVGANGLSDIRGR